MFDRKWHFDVTFLMMMLFDLMLCMLLYFK